MTTPTKQQQAAIDAIHTHPRIKVVACAGSGKTTLLRMMAESAQVPSLYLGFNKAIALEAKAKFPSWVKCSTTHALAYRFIPEGLRDKLVRPRGGYVNVAGTGGEVARFFSIPSVVLAGKRVSAAAVGAWVKDTCARWEQSSDEGMMRKHVPCAEILKKAKGDKVEAAQVVATVFHYAQKLWESRINPHTNTLITHDTYLKLYQLSKPVISGVDILYVDEFQDTSPCVMSIITSQTNCKIVMVGDPRQAIYGWRGAVNAMELVDSPEFPMTQSFRYGTQIAKFASAILENTVSLQGNDAIADCVGFGIPTSYPTTRIYRTNSALLMDAVGAIMAGRKVSISVDTADFVKLLQSGEALFLGDIKNVKHDKLLQYASFDELVEDSEDDMEMARLVKVVKSRQSLRFIDVLQTHKNPDDYELLYITAHKSKGLEWENVELGEDFRSPMGKDGWKGLPVEEVNLMYVAATRAQKMLSYSLPFMEWVRFHPGANAS